eukprot:1126992-Rhodomonas_salina.1
MNTDQLSLASSAETERQPSSVLSSAERAESRVESGGGERVGFETRGRTCASSSPLIMRPAVSVVVMPSDEVNSAPFLVFNTRPVRELFR